MAKNETAQPKPGVPVTEAAKAGPIADKVYAAVQKRLKNR